VRGSDPDAALYWLAKMLYAGEDPRFILRRLIILAGEDIGLADPMGLWWRHPPCKPLPSSACRKACTRSSKPRSTWRLPQSNTATSYFKAYERIEQEASATCDHCRMPAGCRRAGHGQGYVYPHMYEEHFFAQQYLPKELLGTYFYKPSSVGYEVKWPTAGALARSAAQALASPVSKRSRPDQDQIDEMKRHIK